LADGTSLLISANNLEDIKMRYAPVLNGVSKWSLVTGLSFNILKTNVMKLIHFQDNSFLPFYIDKQFKK
jgi:type VI protein secretion system component VasA